MEDESEESNYEETSHMIESSSISLGHLQIKNLQYIIKMRI